ncbi:enoyl-CoA hydratase/isomerase family protein [Membranihabitans marinus]|nr:enoyl-CoA hydratase/isomerase family protein [Membranihabitans marinus]
MRGKIHHRIDKNHLGIITIDNQPHNALPAHLLADLETSILDMGDNDAIRVILLQSAGDRVFCAGASFDGLASIQDKKEGKEFFMGFARVINALRSCGKITIARVHGKAVGGGVGLCSAVDYAMASKWASIRLSELSLAIGPFVIGPAVERKIGLSGFSHLALNATEWQTAEWARSKGLFQEVFETVEQLDAYLETFLDRFLDYSPAALAQFKNMFWEGTEDWPTVMEQRAAQSGNLVLTDQAQEAIRKVKKKA